MFVNKVTYNLFATTGGSKEINFISKNKLTEVEVLLCFKNHKNKLISRRVPEIINIESTPTKFNIGDEIIPSNYKSSTIFVITDILADYYTFKIKNNKVDNEKIRLNFNEETNYKKKEL